MNWYKKALKSNKYHLLCHDKEDISKANKEIDQMINRFVNEFDRINDTYPDSDMNGTQSREAILDELTIKVRGWKSNESEKRL